MCLRERGNKIDDREVKRRELVKETDRENVSREDHSTNTATYILAIVSAMPRERYACMHHAIIKKEQESGTMLHHRGTMLSAIV